MLIDNQQSGTEKKCLRTSGPKAIMTSLPAAASNSDCRRRSHPDCRATGVASIQNKVGAFLADPVLNRILTTSKSDIHVRKIMDEGKILLVNLAKGRLGEDSSSLLGGLLVTTIGLAAYSRADIPQEQRRDFFVYVDEFQSFTTMALANMLSELRKYRVGFTIAHQYMHQLDPDIRHAVF